jgi:hypothetical protein
MAAATMILLAGLTAGCDRMRSDSPKPVAESEKGKPAEQSVALPPSQLPQSDGAIKPAMPDVAGSSGQATSQTQSTPKELSKQQEQASMPLSGQVNNHSTPESTDKQPGAKQN